MYAKVDLCKKIIFQRAENWNRSSFLNILTQLAEDLGQLGTLSSKFLAIKILYAWTSKYGQNIFSFLKWSIPTSPVFVGQIEFGSWCLYHCLPTVILPELCISETHNSNLLLSSYSPFAQKGEHNDLILASLIPNFHLCERDSLSPYHRLKWGMHLNSKDDNNFRE